MNGRTELILQSPRSSNFRPLYSESQQTRHYCICVIKHRTQSRIKAQGGQLPRPSSEQLNGADIKPSTRLIILRDCFTISIINTRFFRIEPPPIQRGTIRIQFPNRAPSPPGATMGAYVLYAFSEYSHRGHYLVHIWNRQNSQTKYNPRGSIRKNPGQTHPIF